MLKKILKKIYISSLRFRDFMLYKIVYTQRPKYDKKYDFVICAIFKDEARFLKEWIEFHALIGVNHFYLYNNNSTDNYKEVLQPYVESGLVTLIDWPISQGQVSAYKNFYDNYWEESQWISFLDIDEFFVPKKDMTLREWMKRHERYPVVLVYWKMFGSSGLLNHNDDRLCIEQYTKSWESLVRCGKCWVNTDFEIASFDAGTHHATQVRDRKRIHRIKLHPVDVVNHVYVSDKEEVIQRKLSQKMDIQINHYWSKAWDVFDKKRSWEGDVFFQNNPKKNIYYFIKNEIMNTTEDSYIQKFRLLLEWKMKGMPEYREMLETENIFAKEK